MRSIFKNLDVLVFGMFWSVMACTSTIKVIDVSEALSLLPCAPSLMSRVVGEAGYTHEFSTRYGEYEFVRTDVGDTEGQFTLNRGGDKICEIELGREGLNFDVYFSAKLKILALSAQSGSNSWFELYRVRERSCEHLGKTNPNSLHIRGLFDNHDGGRACVVTMAK